MRLWKPLKSAMGYTKEVDNHCLFAAYHQWCSIFKQKRKYVWKENKIKNRLPHEEWSNSILKKCDINCEHKVSEVHSNGNQ